MDKMEWAIWSLDYLEKARRASAEDFNAAMEELRGQPGANKYDWYHTCKNVMSTLYHFSIEFVQDTRIPCAKFASPDAFEAELDSYRLFVKKMATDLDSAGQKHKDEMKADEPYLVGVVRHRVMNVLTALDYVQLKKPTAPAANPVEADIGLILVLARRFHEAVLSLSTHPHKGGILSITNEWDCQYLFRAILSAYISDIRDEEWNPSVASSSARCDFFLKNLRAMIELKFVRKASDAKKIKEELAVDFVEYGGNPQVDSLICLVYDPTCALKNPTSIETDLSGPKAGLTRVDVVISPPRG